MKKSYIALLVVFVIGLFNYKNIILLFSLTYILLGCNNSHKYNEIKENEIIDSIAYVKDTWGHKWGKKIVIKDASKIEEIKDTLQNSDAHSKEEFVKLPASTGTIIIYTSTRKIKHIVRGDAFISGEKHVVYTNKNIPSIFSKLGKQEVFYK